MFNSIKKLISKEGERIIVVEDGKPSYVVLTFEEYQHLRSFEKSISINYKKDEDYTMNNRDVNSFHSRDNFQSGEQKRQDMGANASNSTGANSAQENSNESGIRIEDLPF
ncbi:MAG: hypothetical protein A3B96_03020 [Candidatus Spechtbacteria bacterium RIFCSPHIGHO2_02_FULL_43_15b]|uniref:Antitoxin n=1 Tax=Candidatus Spechtbacteria bacterium RIFCSPHIGHO2_01_FULL_43_30 TaxID=1802158 RepID=A0A1G2H8G8_9BACT|nr:MAG: hypothetical protein A2827_00630 [Candidatus Spechtbacteria bacterium RIFCSPHIGHO2_01_FULL_43_30]OGZ59717.1 MAG: hypothetical protein A3B96_03020 [Candidatus Spechtbacteria bacterium RIFCSPHIGHO2_02_FULL_43_15b]